MELEEQYGMADLRQYVSGRPPFPTIPPPGDLFSSGHRNLTQPQHHYEMVMVGRHQVGASMVPCGHPFEFRSGCTTAAAASVTGASTTSVVSGMEMEGGDGCGGGGSLGGGDGGSGRWPRQETLTLLEIRSRLDSKFKEANQKGPLWDEVSRIMSEEHGYQRSGKKCREKFENLYKYYKKTKEGKAGRQDGKHYRFFRQLEALYGDNTSHPNSSSASETHLMGNSFQFHNTNNNINHVGQLNLGPFQAPKLCDSLTLSNSSEMGTSSSDDEIDTNEALLTENDSDEKKKKKKKKKRRRGWKAKIRDFIDSQMRKIMEKQEEWLERMMKILESKEQERISRDEEWRNQEAARIERDRKFWANERAWMEARDSALMEALKKLIRGKEARYSSPENENESESITNASDGWSECEITKLMELRSSSADSSRFQESGSSEEALWEEIAAKMSCLGYNRSALVCKEKWDRISNYLTKTKEWNNKKGREDLKSCSHFHHHNNESVYNQGGGAYYWDINEQGAEPEISTRVAPNDSCFRLLVGADDGGGNVNLWENYGMKLGKE